MKNIMQHLACTDCGTQESMLFFSRQTKQAYCISCKEKHPNHFPSPNRSVADLLVVWRVYKIISKKDASTVYIGSTKYKLQYRLSQHKGDARELGGANKKFKWILENYDDLEILEIKEANDKREALCLEETEILAHIEQGYRVLNTEYPTTNFNLPHCYKLSLYPVVRTLCNDIAGL